MSEKSLFTSVRLSGWYTVLVNPGCVNMYQLHDNHQQQIQRFVVVMLLLLVADLCLTTVSSS